MTDVVFTNYKFEHFFKCLNNLSRAYLKSHFDKPCHSTNTRTKSNGSLHLPVVPKTNAARHTFQYLGTLGWNKLTTAQRQAKSLNQFKSLLAL